jgi:hypothetical protein
MNANLGIGHRRREPFTTIDDLLHKAQELCVGLRKPSGYNHPLDVRRGVRKGVKKCMNDDRQSRQIKGSGRENDLLRTRGCSENSSTLSSTSTPRTASL